MINFNKIPLSIKELLKGGMTGILVKVISAALALILSYTLVDLLGTESLGIFYLAQSLIFLFGTASVYGLNFSMLKLVSPLMDNKEFKNGRQVYNYINFRVLIIGLVVSSIYYLFSSYLAISIFHKEEIEPVIKTGALSIVLFSLILLQISAHRSYKNVALSLGLRGIIIPFLFLFLAFAFSINSAKEAMLAFEASLFVTLLLGGFVWNTKTQSKECKNNQRKVVFIPDLWKVANSMFVVQMLQIVILHLPTLLLGVYSSGSDVSLFSISIKISGLISFVLVAINAISGPKFATLYKQNRMEELKAIVKWNSRFLLTFSIPALLLLITFSNEILGTFDSSFADGHIILITLCIGTFINTITGSVGLLLSMTGHQKIFRNNVLIASIFALLISFILIPEYGALGAAISTALALSTSNLLSWYKIKKIFNINTLNVF
jgi:O-antigen/teichoic acid export membrane protein